MSSCGARVRGSPPNTRVLHDVGSMTAAPSTQRVRAGSPAPKPAWPSAHTIARPCSTQCTAKPRHADRRTQTTSATALPSQPKRQAGRRFASAPLPAGRSRTSTSSDPWFLSAAGHTSARCNTRRPVVVPHGCLAAVRRGRKHRCSRGGGAARRARTAPPRATSWVQFSVRRAHARRTFVYKRAGGRERRSQVQKGAGTLPASS